MSPSVEGRMKGVMSGIASATESVSLRCWKKKYLLLKCFAHISARSMEKQGKPPKLTSTPISKFNMRRPLLRLEGIEHAGALRADAECQGNAQTESNGRADASVGGELLAGLFERRAVALLQVVLEVLFGQGLEFLAGVAAQHGE